MENQEKMIKKFAEERRKSAKTRGGIIFCWRRWKNCTLVEVVRVNELMCKEEGAAEDFATACEDYQG